MNSRLYCGEVMHHRFAPVVHDLRYPLYVASIDLDELELLHQKLSLFGHNRRNVFSLRDRDYLFGEKNHESGLKEELLALPQLKKYRAGTARVQLVTALRYFGRLFNPVSFYFLYDRKDVVLAVVAEVNNTFGDRHLYILEKPLKSGDGFLRFSRPKQFHVSPFNDRSGHYDFELALGADELDLRITLSRDGQKIMVARLSGRGRKFDAAGLRHILLHYPLSGLKTMWRIYKEAFKLFVFRGLKYHPRPAPASEMTIGVRKPRLWHRLAMALVLRFVRRARRGCLALELPDRRTLMLGDAANGVTCHLRVTGYRFFTRALRGAVGLGEARVAGDWESDDVVAVLRFFADNIDYISALKIPLAGLLRRAGQLPHLLRGNSRRGSRKNIHRHYDLGNDFFASFLDRSMMYSCAMFRKPSDSLYSAQMYRLQQLIDRLRLDAGSHLLEIGSGWGTMAIEAARRTGCRVTTATISREQYDYVAKRIKQEGLQKRVGVVLCDYRDLQGSFDAIISIEMLEAVGHSYFPAYFKALERLLAPQGVVVLQVITTPDHNYDTYRRRTDWIQRYIFPGGHLPSLAALTRAMASHSRLVVEELFNIGPHYARTLLEWRKNFDAAEKKLEAMGYDENFRNLWRYYLQSCEAGFASRLVNDLVLVLSRRNNCRLD